MTARIFKPAKNAMQSGKAQTKEWQLEYEPEQPRAIEPLMGWTSSGDMKQQLSLLFDSKEEAVAYCERKGIPYQVIEPKQAVHRFPVPIEATRQLGSRDAGGAYGPIQLDLDRGLRRQLYGGRTLRAVRDILTVCDTGRQSLADRIGCVSQRIGFVLAEGRNLRKRRASDQ